MEDNFRVKLIQWEGYKSIALILAMSICAIVGFLGKGLILNYVFRYAPKNRPINTMIAIDQICQLASSAVFIVMAIVSLTYGTALEELLGQKSCVVFSIAQAIHAASLLIGGFAMATYRLCILWYQQLLGKILGPFKFFHWILIFEGFAMILVVGLLWFELEKYGTSSEMEFCTGYSLSSIRNFLSNNNNHHKNEQGRSTLIVVVLILQTFMCSEMVIYISIFWKLYKQNQKENRALSKEVIRLRNNKNAISLSGQVSTFVAEVTGTLIAQTLIMNNDGVGVLEPAAFTCCSIVIIAVISALQIVTSPELRRFYLYHNHL